MTAQQDFGQQNIDLMIEFNRRLIEADEGFSIPDNAVLVFIPDDPDHRRHNIEAGLRMIEKGYDVFFKRVSIDENSKVTWTGRKEGIDR
jgi:hypothetical protein